MTTSINRAPGFILCANKVPQQPFVVLSLTMRCSCCGSLKPQVVTTLGVN